MFAVGRGEPRILGPERVADVALQRVAIGFGLVYRVLVSDFDLALLLRPVVALLLKLAVLLETGDMRAGAITAGGRDPQRDDESQDEPGIHFGALAIQESNIQPKAKPPTAAPGQAACAIATVVRISIAASQ